MFLYRAGEPANFLAALAPDFFFKRLRLWLLILSQAAPAPGIFFPAALAPAPRGKKTAPAPVYWLSFAKYSFPHKRVKQMCYILNVTLFSYKS